MSNNKEIKASELLQALSFILTHDPNAEFHFYFATMIEADICYYIQFDPDLYTNFSQHALNELARLDWIINEDGNAFEKNV